MYAAHLWLIFMVNIWIMMVDKWLMMVHGLFHGFQNAGWLMITRDYNHPIVIGDHNHPRTGNPYEPTSRME